MLADRSEIADLVNRLGRVLDEGRFDEMRSLLVEEATARTPGGTAEGRDAMVAQASRNHRPEQAIQHLITNLLVDLDGDRASARANLVVHFGPAGGGGDGPASQGGPPAPPAPPVEFTLGEVYRFELVRTPQGWRFARVETTPVWMSGVLPDRR
ncbi:MAG TPA: nuclear transport factor 2 family protein [Iamia sp.]|nr:nuclear transport factor 2 family protein [Iamia sp.]